MKILVNDGMEAEALEKLKALGYDVDDNQYKGEDLLKKIKEVDVIVVRSATKVRKEGTKIVEVLEVEYIDYSEYQRRMADFYEFHRVHIEEEKEAGEEPGYTTPYRFFIEEFLYGNAEIVE